VNLPAGWEVGNPSATVAFAEVAAIVNTKMQDTYESDQE
jgi:hypothetical protein